MPRIPYPDLSRLPQKRQEFMARVDPNVNVFRMLPWAEDVFEHWHRLGNALLHRTAVDAVTREIPILRVGHLMRAKYEVHQHERIAARVGMPAEKIAALRAPDLSAFGPAEAALIRFTDEVVGQVRASDPAFAELRRHFDERQVVELVLLIGYYQMTCTFLENLDIPIEEEGAIDDP